MSADSISGAQNCVCCSQWFILITDLSFGSKFLGNFNKTIFHFLSKTTNYKGDLLNFFIGGLCYIFHEALYYCLSCNRDQRFWHSEGVWSHSFAHSRHWNNNIHNYLLFWAAKINYQPIGRSTERRNYFPVCPNPPVSRSVDESSVVFSHTTISCFATTICAILSPGLI